MVPESRLFPVIDGKRALASITVFRRVMAQPVLLSTAAVADLLEGRVALAASHGPKVKTEPRIPGTADTRSLSQEQCSQRQQSTRYLDQLPTMLRPPDDDQSKDRRSDISAPQQVRHPSEQNIDQQHGLGKPRLSVVARIGSVWRSLRGAERGSTATADSTRTENPIPCFSRIEPGRSDESHQCHRTNCSSDGSDDRSRSLESDSSRFGQSREDTRRQREEVGRQRVDRCPTDAGSNVIPCLFVVEEYCRPSSCLTAELAILPALENNVVRSS